MLNRPESLRAELLEKLRSEGRTDLSSRLAKCGESFVLRCAGCTEPLEARKRCDLKWCPTCARALAARTADRYARIMAHVQWPLFVTLTAQHSIGDAMTMREHRRAWGKLRRLRWFRSKVPGGVMAWEITDSGNGMHVHAHGLFDCRWLSVTTSAPGVGATKETWAKKQRAAASEVSEQWSLCCGRKATMKVRRVWTSDGGNIRDALTEVVKYATKGSDLVNQPNAGRIIDQLEGTRLLTSFGSCFGKPEFKRQRSAPKMCKCGCTEWLPEAVLARQAVNEHGLTARQSRRR